MTPARIQLFIATLLTVGSVEGRAGESADHWAFRPVVRPPLPTVRDASWVETPLDAFILARMEGEGLSPAGDVDRRTLLRRVTYDLAGLPPAYEEVTAFERDPSPDAFRKVVDRLLASPAYGERWGRHWLDVARYANTVGDNPGRDNIAPYNYTYRDYVIDAYNRDLPYDRFVLEQIAADRLDLGGDKRPLAALGFITVGRRFLGNIHDTLDDRIDVVTRGLMGLTVQCARCHDHKFEPISIEDYYALYGVFAGSVEPAEPPVIAEPSDPAAHRAFLEEKKRRQDAVEAFRREKHREILADFRRRTGDYLLTAWEVRDETDPVKVERLVRERGLHPLGVGRWKEKLAATDLKNDSVFSPWLAFASLPPEEFEEPALVLTLDVARDPRVNWRVAQALGCEPPKTLKEVAERYGRLLNEAVGGDASDDPDVTVLRQIVHGDAAPGNLPEPLLNQLITGTMQIQLAQLQAQIDLLEATHPGAPPRAPVLEDRPNPRDAHVLLRGNPRTPGPPVPRRFLRVLGGDDARPFTDGSGRLELARAIASRDNPLTARVLVNHIWMHHFGSPLVETPDDFGVRTAPPTHPELLDYLAARFIDSGWSIKRLHRMIVLSHAYRVGSDLHGTGVSPVNPPKAEPENVSSTLRVDDGRDTRPTIDPDNRWLARMNRRRLEFEAMRDTLLAVSGSLDRSFGGKPVKLTDPPYPTRRSVYAFIDRQSLPDLLRAFDFADPDACTARRFNTTVPQQALFFMNSPFVTGAAGALAARATSASPDDAERVRLLHRWVFQREPDAEELSLALEFLGRGDADEPQGSAASRLGPWERYAQVLLQSNELTFVD